MKKTIEHGLIAYCSKQADFQGRGAYAMARNLDGLGE